MTANERRAATTRQDAPAATPRATPPATSADATKVPPSPAALLGPDALFANPRPKIEDFDFGRETAAVFDDMLDRSVPFYEEIQRMVAELAVDFAAPGTAIYDLGCSTCTSFLQIDAVLAADAGVKFVGIDSSDEMLLRARAKLEQAGFAHPFELRCANLDHGLEIENASVALLILTLQFVRPLYRKRIVRTIADGLAENGCLILVEKVLGENSTYNRLFIKHYYEMKRRNGYSELEIAQKREALENVLVPYRLEENRQMLAACGFRNVDVFFKWYNFCGIVAMK